MSPSARRTLAILSFAAAVLAACLGAARPRGASTVGILGVDVSGLSPVVTHPFAPFSLIKRAVFEGHELDEDTKDTLQVRVLLTVREAPEPIAGAMATVVETVDYEQGAIVEKSREYYAQDRSGAVFLLAEKVDDVSDGKVVGHAGQWVAGEKRARAGLYMPAEPAVGGVFEQEVAPGVSESRSRVSRMNLSVTVPFGDCADCLETDVVDPATKATGTKIYCRGKGRVSDWSKMHSLKLVELELRTPPPQPEAK